MVQLYILIYYTNYKIYIFLVVATSGDFGWIGDERPWSTSIRKWRDCQYVTVQIASPEGWALLPDTTQTSGLHFTPKSENMLSVSMFLFFIVP